MFFYFSMEYKTLFQTFLPVVVVSGLEVVSGIVVVSGVVVVGSDEKWNWLLKF